MKIHEKWRKIDFFEVQTEKSETIIDQNRKIFRLSVGASIKQQPITNYIGKARDLFSGDLLKYLHLITNKRPVTL